MKHLFFFGKKKRGSYEPDEHSWLLNPAMLNLFCVIERQRRWHNLPAGFSSRWQLNPAVHNLWKETLKEGRGGFT